MSKTSTTGEVRLRKALRSYDVFFLSVTGMVGSGWLFAEFGSLPYAGPASILSWVVAGVFFFVIGLCFAELGGILPFTGSLVRYNHYSHGALSNFLLGWAYIIAAATTPPLEAEAILTYAHSYIPGVYNATTGVLTPLGIVLALALMAVFTVIQYIGVNVYGTVNTVVTAWKLIIPILTAILLLLFTFHPSNFSLKGGFLPFGPASIFVALVPSGIAFAVEGFRQGLEYSGETRNPQRDVPLGLVMAMIVVIALYIVLQISMIGALNWSNLKLTPGDWGNLSNSSWAASPFYHALISYANPVLSAFAIVILIDAAVSPAATLGVYVGTTARSLYGFSRLKYFPKIFGNLNPRFQTPTFSLILTFIIGAIFLIPFPSWYSLVGISASFTVYNYLAAGITNHVFRRVAPNLKRPFDPKLRLPLYFIGFLVGSLIIYWSGWSIVNPMFVTVAAALPLFVVGYNSKLSLKRSTLVAFVAAYWVSIAIIGVFDFLNLAPFPYYWAAYSLLLILSTYFLYSKTKLSEIKAASWIVAYNIIVGVISYYGSLGIGAISSFTTRDPVRKGGELTINTNKIKKIGDVP
ncbi:amino acid transporter [Candidatus Marsarchaeota G1 archaeon OSP_B]|jgi:Amino acid transporters|uniref:Amino acid transporter n=2 Tax=Candidatus Marsarchaeota group 1 TaxID=2203770 RepID=A0A2R6AAS4_9ARCH|nr:MAG: amino acid transporter [Candidatus Marsarchaeota G1 archaeon OSP_D]PSN92926.1 MAG: amino acid transporter [Candidatus Marsarchaeota G1 archaeon OSP_B]